MSRPLVGQLWPRGDGGKSAPTPDTSFGIADWGAPGSTFPGAEQLGWRFAVDEPLTVVALAHYNLADDNGIDNVMRLWRAGDQQLLATATVVGLTSQRATIPIAPVNLATGQTYVVTCRRLDGASRTVNRAYGSIVMHEHVNYVDSVFIDSDGYPSSTSSSDYRVYADIVFHPT